jgi:putative hydrolase of the HAD superfamily
VTPSEDGKAAHAASVVSSARASRAGVLRSKGARGYRAGVAGATEAPAPNSPLKQPRAILLDAGNTLFYERPSRFDVYAEAARALGLEADLNAVAVAMRTEHERLPRVEGEPVRYTDRWFETYVPAVFRSLGAPEPLLVGLASRLLERFRRTAMFHLFPETLEVLDALRARGVRTAVVSNWSPRLPGHLAALGVAERVDAALVSAIEGVEKPACAIFERALDRLGVRPQDALHVGDHLVNDVQGARAAGIRALLLSRDGAPSEPGVDIIGSLRDLLSPQLGALA